MKMKYLTLCLILASLLSGCGEDRLAQEPMERVCLSGVSKTLTMVKIESILKEMNFEIAKMDIEQGYVKTKPLPAAQWFEFWRSDNVGGRNTVAANVQTLRRIAEFNVTEVGSKICVACTVKVQRLNLPERTTTGSTEGYAMFSESESSMQRLSLSDKQKQGAQWTDMDNDRMLSTAILKKLNGAL